MAELVGIMDTGVMCCWLEVPGKDTGGPDNDKWDKKRATSAIDDIIKNKGTIILPSAVIIETANHIAQGNSHREILASRLLDRVIAASAGTRPWREFRDFDRIWTPEWFADAKNQWPIYASRKVGLADYSIISIANYFSLLGSSVRTLTTDTALYNEVSHLETSAVNDRRRRS